MLSRFELFVFVRTQVADRRRLRRSLAREAVMEDLAARTGQDVARAGMIGLCADVDAELCEHNPDRLGVMAEELLRAEGVPDEVAAAARERLRAPPEEMSLLAATLCVADSIVEDAYGAIEAGDPLDEVDPGAVARRVVRAAERRDDRGAQRVLACLGRLPLSLEEAAAVALAAMKRVREDLRL